MPEREKNAVLSRYRLVKAPGHLIRRCQQRHLDLYTAEVGEGGPTPRQFAVLLTIFQNPGLSQTALSERTGIDRSTIADMLNRLHRRGLIERRRPANDGRVRLLRITEAGVAHLEAAVPGVDRAQERILETLPPADRPVAMRCLRLLAGLPAEVPDDGEDAGQPED